MPYSDTLSVPRGVGSSFYLPTITSPHNMRSPCDHFALGMEEKNISSFVNGHRIPTARHVDHVQPKQFIGTPLFIENDYSPFRKRAMLVSSWVYIAFQPS